ncbi:uncharacterized protein LOC132555511 [Ylistrum balloti]|uniref:uncharacterized protein LOC132555511 n=1 Tax=Ylistrum balloti TaxID=509963 RepID=UPI00290597E0|nr:uncharacterized protein LOC132555511 [Ylistrum balloti]
MNKLIEYESSDDDSSEGLCKSDEDDSVVTNVHSKSKNYVGDSKDFPSCKLHQVNSMSNFITEHHDTESGSDKLPEEGEIVSKPISADKTPNARKSKFKRRGNAVVAFSAYMRTCVCQLIDGVIPFEKMTMNYGKGYKRRLSTFVCPRSGTYLITWRVVLVEVREITLNLTVNGEVKKRTTFDSTDSSDNNKCEREEIIKLFMRDRVCMTLYDGDSRLLRPTKCKFAGIRLMR